MFAYLDPIWQFLTIPKTGLIALGLISFLASTVIPLGSEPYLLVYLGAHPDQYFIAIMVATLGNTLGGASTWYLGSLGNQFVSKEAALGKHPRILKYLEKFETKLLLFSWLPICGDLIAGLAGWLKLSFTASMVYMFIGKFLRYLLITKMFLHFY